MEDGSKILIFVICLNLVGLSLTGLGYYTTNFSYAVSNDYISEFLILDPASRLFGFGGAGLTLSDNLNSNISSVLEPASSGVSILDNVVGVFLDGLKMIIGFLTFLTPIPIISFAVSLGLPIVVMLFVFVPLIIRYVLAVVEMVRSGGKF